MILADQVIDQPSTPAPPGGASLRMPDAPVVSRILSGAGHSPAQPKEHRTPSSDEFSMLRPKLIQASRY